MTLRRRQSTLLCFTSLLVCAVGTVVGQQRPVAEASDDLARRQERVASKYAQLEALMLKMAQLEAAQNPRRAALLTQALTKSKDGHTKLQLETIVELLGKRQLSRAVREQVDAEKSLEELLKLLQSEDRTERNKTEQERIKEYIKEVERMIRIQRSLQGQNEGGGEAKRIAELQAKLAERAAELAEKIKEEEEGEGKGTEEEGKGKGEQGKEEETPEDQKSGEPKSGESKSGEPKSGEPKSSEPKSGEPKSGEPKSGEPKSGEPKSGEPKSGEPKSGEPKSGEPKSGEPKSGEPKSGEPKSGEPKSGEPKSGEPKSGEPKSGEPKSGEPKSGEPKSGEPKSGEPKSGEPKSGEPKSGEPMPGESKAEDQQNPVQQRIEQAQQRMKAAEQKLDEAQRKESVEEQEKAREELEKAKAELEKILRQLREEEMERTLQALEGRFRKMLEMQVRVYEATKKLDAIPAAERTREIEVQAGRLGGDEAKIAVEAQRAMQLLEEEGSSVAFPATVDLIIDDMQQTAERLNEGRVDTITQGLEEDIIASLEELLAALEQAQKKLEEQKKQEQQQPQQSPPGQQEQPLVDAIQELKMIKSLQLRVNKRTDRFARLLQDENDPVGQANTKELLLSLDQLSERQQQIFDIVREILLGRNK